MVIATTSRRNFRIGADISHTRTLDEALTVAGLDWSIVMRDFTDLSMWTDTGDLLTTSSPGMRLAMRSDNHVTMGVVGGVYVPVSNRDVFGLGESLIDQGARPSRAGEIDHGRRVFMDLDIPGAQVKLANGKDLVNFGATVKASHDGKGKVIAKIVGERLWCTNGCTVQIKGIPNTFEVRHTATAQARMAEAHRVMAGAGRYVAAFTGAAERLLGTKMSLSEFCAYIDALFPRPEETGRALTMWETRRAELLKLWKFADTNDLGRGTAWGAFNSVTEYLDWGAPVRATKGATVDETRALRRHEDTNATLRDTAWTFALAV